MEELTDDLQSLGTAQKLSSTHSEYEMSSSTQPAPYDLLTVWDEAQMYCQIIKEENVSSQFEETSGIRSKRLEMQITMLTSLDVSQKIEKDEKPCISSFLHAPHQLLQKFENAGFQNSVESHK